MTAGADTLPAVNAAQLVSAIGLTLGSWILLGSLCAGAGLLALKLVGRQRTDAEALLPAFWSGLCLFIGFLQLYNFARPIDAIPFALLCLFGITGLAAHGRQLGASLIKTAKAHPIASTALTLTLIFFADRAIASPGNCYDTGLYHASVVRWAVTYPVVPGLANLHCRLGFNNSIHLFGAALTSGPWGHLAPHIVNGLIFAALSVQGVVALSRLFMAPGRSDVARSILDALVLPPFVLLACQFELTGLSSDGVAAALLVVAASRIVGMTVSPATDSSDLFVTSLLLSTALTVKLSMAPFAGIAWMLAAALTVRGIGPASFKEAVRLLVAPALVAAMLIAPWMIRGVVLSGYPFFPSTLLGAPVEWKVPPESAKALTKLILTWARWRGPESGSWLAPWTEWALFGQVLWICVPTGIGAIAAAVSGWLVRRPPARLLLALPCVVGIIVWFLTAPDPRFVFVLFWILAATLAGAVRTGTPFKERVLRHTVAGITLALAVAAIVQRPPLIGPGPDRGFHPMPDPDVVEGFTESGLKVYLPAVRDQTWDAPLPSAPFLTPGLKLRVPGDMTRGFVIDPGAVR